MKRILALGLALFISAFLANSALALTPNHSYTVELATVSTSGQQTAVDRIDATTDANGKLSFQFAGVPDTGTAPFLMVQIMDTAGGQQQVVRQTLVPSPASGQHMQMGVSEVSSRQTQVALQAMQSASGNQALSAMFPILMVPTGAISSTDVSSLGQAANSGVTSFNGYLNQNGAPASQINSFQNGMLDAMRDFAAANKTVVDQADSGIAAGLYGKASAKFMSAMIQAGVTAGIDPFLMSAAFDQAGQSITNSPALNNLPAGDIDAMQASFLADAQQRLLMAQVGGYGAAMPVVQASLTQTQTFTTARYTLQTAMLQARQIFFQNAFADPTTLPDQATIDQALNSMQTAMQTAFDNFNQDTTATSAQVDDMLGVMATGMGGMGGMGGGMMSGSTLMQMGFGMMQTTLNGTTQNWSIMMVAASNLVPDVPGFAYTPMTNDLISQFFGNAPTPPDWSQIPYGPYKSILQLQYDLMLVRLIDAQAMAGLTMPPTQDDLASISATDLDNRIAIRQGLQGLTVNQMGALMTELSPPMLAF